MMTNIEQHRDNFGALWLEVVIMTGTLASAFVGVLYISLLLLFGKA